jgi:2-dehydro-3-deoxygluconokinase
MAEEKREMYNWGEILPGFNPSRDTKYEVMAFGGLIHRLDPGKKLWPKATEVEIHADSGAEFNLAANCNAYGLKSAVLTAKVDYPIGDMVKWQIGASGVDIIGPTFEHSPWGPHHAAVYSGRPGPNKKNVVDYNRSDEAALLIKPGMFNYENIFEGGVKWVHVGGLYEALGPHAPDMMLEYIRAGKEQGAIASMDLNFRGKLVTADRRIRVKEGHEFLHMDKFEEEYGAEPPDEDAILETYRGRTKEIVREVDVLFANETDIANCLGIAGNEGDTIDTAVTKAQQAEVMDKFENLKVVVTSLRDEYDNIEHIWGAVATIRQPDGKYLQVESPIKKIHVEDRIGGGDGNAGGFVASMFYGYTPQEAVINGVESGKLVASVQDDNAAGAKWRDVIEKGKKVKR